jgi:ABC-type lipoprotein release transport system permease subunit
VSKYLILEAISYAFNSIDATEYLFYTSNQFRKLISLNLIALSNIFKTPIVNVMDRFERLFNKSIQQSNLQVELYNEKDLEILRLFLKEIKLKIEKLSIYSSSTFDVMTKEDFELMKP